MGLTTGDFPPVDPQTFMETPYRERLKTLSRHWADYGFGAPKITTLIYIAKLVFLYMLGGVLVSTLTSHLNPLHPSAWSTGDSTAGLSTPTIFTTTVSHAKSVNGSTCRGGCRALNNNRPQQKGS